MTKQTKILGAQAESLAATLLQSHCLKILKRNLVTKLGEIDILARDGRILVIVEVKAKTSARFGSALEMITEAKKRKLILLAHQLQGQYQTPNVRVDVVTVDEAASQPLLRHYRGIVELNR